MTKETVQHDQTLINKTRKLIMANSLKFTVGETGAHPNINKQQIMDSNKHENFFI